MLEAPLAGVSDPGELAELARGRMRAKIPQLQEALRGRFDLAHHGVLVASLLGHIDSLDVSIDNLDQRIAYETGPMDDLVELICTIPGVGLRTGQVLIAECGIDMSVFPSAGHFASWAGICPGTNTSAGKRYSGKTRRGSKWCGKPSASRRRRQRARRAPTSPPTTPTSVRRGRRIADHQAT